MCSKPLKHKTQPHTEERIVGPCGEDVRVEGRGQVRRLSGGCSELRRPRHEAGRKRRLCRRRCRGRRPSQARSPRGARLRLRSSCSPSSRSCTAARLLLLSSSASARSGGSRSGGAGGGRRRGALEDVGAARRAGLLALEPGAQAVLVEDVRAGQLLARVASLHLLAADDAHVVHRAQVLRRRVRIHALQVPASTQIYEYAVIYLLPISICVHLLSIFI